MNSETIEALEGKIGYTFRDRSLLVLALTHTSFANEAHSGHLGSNERLEFLGDAVLELVSSDFFYREKPKLSEGELTKLRASFVCEPALAYCAEQIPLPPYLLLGRGDDRRQTAPEHRERCDGGGDRCHLSGRRSHTGARLH